MKHYQDKFSMIKKIIGKQNPVIIEIGAHYGEDSLRLLETFSQLKLYCFEPDPRNIAAFKAHVNDNRIELFEVALSDTTGTATFYQSYQEYRERELPPKYDWIDKDLYLQEALNNSGSSSLKKGYKFVLDGSILVETKRFDEWSLENNIEQIDFAWIDVQGAEKEVLDGMGDHIRKIKLLWIEYGESQYEGALGRRETIEYLDARGFVVVEKFSSHSAAGDLLFLRKENV
jgi:FkbM family methyltransferase